MVLVGAGLSREWGDAVNGTGFAGVRGTSPLHTGSTLESRPAQFLYGFTREGLRSSPNWLN